MDNDKSFAAVFDMSVTEIDSSLKSLVERVDQNSTDYRQSGSDRAMDFEDVDLGKLGTSSLEMDTLKENSRGSAREVCLCGHGISRHFKQRDAWMCMVTKIWCRCSEPLPVLQSEDLKPFMFKTTGAGPHHALTKGLHALSQKGKGVKWIIVAQCQICRQSDAAVHATPLAENNRFSVEYAKQNALLCLACLKESGGYL